MDLGSEPDGAPAGTRPRASPWDAGTERWRTGSGRTAAGATAALGVARARPWSGRETPAGVPRLLPEAADERERRAIGSGLAGESGGEDRPDLDVGPAGVVEEDDTAHVRSGRPPALAVRASVVAEERVLCDEPDEPEARLVVFGPEHPHSGKTVDSPARVAARRFLDERSGGPRFNRNMLVFLAPDRSRLAELRLGVRDFLAWRSIEAEKESLNLGAFQSQQAETKRAQFDEVVTQRIGETFTWVLVPSQAPGDPEISWEETRATGPEPLAVRVGKKLRNEEALITEYSGARLRMDLDRVPLWRGDHVTLRQLWSDYSQYLYLPRFRDSAVLLDAVRSGIALLSWTTDTFVYASAYDEQAERYVGLTAGQHAAVVLDATSVVVKAEVALRQMDRDQVPSPETAASAARTEPTSETPATARDDGVTDRAVRASASPTRFYGRVTLEPLRMIRDVGDIADTIINQLGRADAAVTISLEIEATADGGFPEDVRRSVDENARTLKFDAHEFEDG